MAGRAVPPRVETAPSDKPKVYARRPLEYAGQALDRDQVFTLLNAINDEKLLRLGYVAELPKHAQLYECAACGAQFVSVGARTGHGDKRHRARGPLTPMDEDNAVDREERMLEQIAPLYLDKTAAAQGA